MPFVDLTLTKLTYGQTIQNLTLITKFHHFTLKSILQNTFHMFDYGQLGFDQISSFFFFLRESFNLWRPLLMIAFYHKTKTPINFWCKQELNPKFLIQPSKILSIELARTHWCDQISYGSIMINSSSYQRYLNSILKWLLKRSYQT